MNLPISALLRRALPGFAMLAAAMLANCSHMPLLSSSSSEAATSRGRMPTALGTAWGESRESHVADAVFHRAHTRPDGVGELHYQNADLSYGRTFRGPRDLAGGRVAIGIKGQGGRWLSGSERDGKFYVSGRQGERYEIVLRNQTRTQIEVVVSVDGLDVLDGRSASFSKSGYIIEPRGTITIPGWRTSSDSVAAFRFAAVADSYAAKKHGDTRNVGVIGVAVFTPKLVSTRDFAEPPPPDRQPNPFPGER